MDAIKTDGNGPYLVRDPRSKLPISVDWSAWLTRENTTIASSSWSAGTGVTLETPSNTPTLANVIVSGGAAGATYVIRNTITCANGIVDSRSIRVVTRDR